MNSRVGTAVRILAAAMAIPAIAYGLFILASSVFGIHFLWVIIAVASLLSGVLLIRVAWTGRLPFVR